MLSCGFGLALARGQGGIEVFSPMANFRAPLDQVEVRGWDPAKKEEITATAKKGSELWTLPGQKQGAALAKFGGHKPEAIIAHRDVVSKEHAEAVAKAYLTKHAME